MKFVETNELLRQIRAYNNVLGLTSIGTFVCDSTVVDVVYVSDRQGVYTFTICHRISSLLPEECVKLSFVQVCMYDG
ncbi:Helitron helicase [Phytophthora megakarya]|uniref:Helitron helicase n=1 Tax=Phytophthora megakarya TaxID=4795 RepID=A0A225WMD7_9STRA|nr:Helitron helicase [Phytophthora megakarya]